MATGTRLWWRLVDWRSRRCQTLVFLLTEQKCPDEFSQPHAPPSLSDHSMDRGPRKGRRSLVRELPTEAPDRSLILVNWSEKTHAGGEKNICRDIKAARIRNVIEQAGQPGTGFAYLQVQLIEWYGVERCLQVNRLGPPRSCCTCRRSTPTAMQCAFRFRGRVSNWCISPYWARGVHSATETPQSCAPFAVSTPVARRASGGRSSAGVPPTQLRLNDQPRERLSAPAAREIFSRRSRNSGVK